MYKCVTAFAVETDKGLGIVKINSVWELEKEMIKNVRLKSVNDNSDFESIEISKEDFDRRFREIEGEV